MGGQGLSPSISRSSRWILTQGVADVFRLDQLNKSPPSGIPHTLSPRQLSHNIHQDKSVHLHGSRRGSNLCCWWWVAVGVGSQLLQQLCDAQRGPHLGARQADLLFRTQRQQFPTANVLQEDKHSFQSDLPHFTQLQWNPSLRSTL